MFISFSHHQMCQSHHFSFILRAASWSEQQLSTICGRVLCLLSVWLSGKDWRQEKGTAEEEMVGWHHQLDGHEFEQTLEVGDGQGCLACCSPWDHKELDTTEWLNWTGLWLEVIGNGGFQIIFLNTTSVFCLFILAWRNLFDLQFGGGRLYCKDSTGGPGWAPDSLLRDWGDLDGIGVLFHHQDYMGGGQGVKISTAVHQALRCVACMCMLSHVQFWNLMDSSLPGSSVHGISQARIVEWVAISSSRGSSQPRDQTCISCIGRQIL